MPNFKHDFNKIYIMTRPDERFIIIQQINNQELKSETKTGIRQKWWLIKHNPDNEIPKNIYLLGDGTIPQLHKKYKECHGYIEWEEFINYTRELIKQNIML